MTNEILAVDAFVGMKLRARRVEVGMSQSALGDALGVTFQQVQKYEKGANRICASTLFNMARHLGVPVAYFFNDYAPRTADSTEPNLSERGEAAGEAAGADTSSPQIDGANVDLLRHLGDREVVKLLTCFGRIRNDKRRQRVLTLVKSIAGG